MTPEILHPDSPCIATVEQFGHEGLSASLFVPTYGGGQTFTITAERDNDGDWRITIPWTEASDTDEPVTLANGDEVLNGFLYLGAPDCPTPRKATK